jgi:hypothetical protein
VEDADEEAALRSKRAGHMFLDARDVPGGGPYVVGAASRLQQRAARPPGTRWRFCSSTPGSRAVPSGPRALLAGVKNLLTSVQLPSPPDVRSTTLPGRAHLPRALTGSY